MNEKSLFQKICAVALDIVFQQYNYRFNVYLLNNSILFSYARNFFHGKLAFDCDILRNFAIGGLSLIKRLLILLNGS